MSTNEIDWRTVAGLLAASLAGCVEQIEQMKGLFGDEDGAIQTALDDASAAETVYRKCSEGMRVDVKLMGAILARGFRIEDCPYTPLQTAWEHLPVIQAIREAEKETGIAYSNPRPPLPQPSVGGGAS